MNDETVAALLLAKKAIESVRFAAASHFEHLEEIALRPFNGNRQYPKDMSDRILYTYKYWSNKRIEANRACFDAIEAIDNLLKKESGK